MKKRSIHTGIWDIFIVMRMCGVIKQFYGFHFGTWKTIQNSVSDLRSVYIREFKDSWFVDVYYFRCHDDNGIDRKHFVIAPGYQMSEEYE